jgi:hypothetical protein
MVCQHHDQCLNNAFCKVCADYSMLKIAKAFRARGLANGKKQGQSFEKKVEKIYNQSKPTAWAEQARRTPASGAMWGSPGDISAPGILMEAKERKASGHGSMSIQKAWLDGIKQEALEAGKPMWCLPFRFKDDEDIYVVLDYRDLVALLKS